MFEDKTYERIVQECLAAAPPDIDLRQGSIFYDAVASVAYKIAQFYADLSTVFEVTFLTTAIGEYLDRRGLEYGVIRHSATPAAYQYLWTGDSEPEIGNRFFAKGFFFVLRKSEEMTLFLEAETPGIGSNNIPYRELAVPVDNINGLTSSVLGTLIKPGANEESDDAYRERILEKISGPAENGNRAHYKMWCESVPDVGRARIIPLFAGDNTVMGVIIGTDGKAAAQSIVDDVQIYVDPMTLNTEVIDAGTGEPIIVGDGLGDGMANIGAHFLAIAPEEVEIPVTFSVKLRGNANIEDVRESAIKELTSYLKNLALNTPEQEEIIVLWSAINALLFSIQGVSDVQNLTLGEHSGPGNIALTDRQVATLGEVVVNADI